MQYKQVHPTSGCIRFLDENGNVLGWEGKVPVDNEDWEDAGTFDPYNYLAQVKTTLEQQKVQANDKHRVAAENLYNKLIQRGYSPEDASASTGYVP